MARRPKKSPRSLKPYGRATAKARQPDASRYEASPTDASNGAASLTDATLTDPSPDEAVMTDASDDAAALTDASQDTVSLTEVIKAIATGYTRIEHAKLPVLADTSFTEVMQDVAGRVRKPAVLDDTSFTEVMQDVASRVRKPPATRQGRKGIVIYVDPEVAAAIHRLAAGLNNATVQDLGVQAFEYLFEKFGEPWPV